MNRLTTLLLALLLLCSIRGVAQTRYLDEVFSSVQRTDSVVYGNNITVIVNPPAARPLIMDVYRPAGDTATNRPVVLVGTTGNFLPAILNGSPQGTIKDSSVVELCTRLAKRGYVAISFFYRQGWAATNPSQDIQTQTLLQAAYRGIQDARTLARFLRKSVAENGNPYGIDPNKIIIGGIGTGGYVSLGAAYLSDFSEILLPKFTNPTTGQAYVDSTVHGNIWGTNTAVLNVPNHVGYSSDFSMVFNVGGALGDSTWIQDGEIPYVGFHTPRDPNAPYDIGVVIVPTTGNTVIDEAAGSYAVARINNRFGNNDIFVNAGFTDPFTVAANATNDGYEGLMPFDRPFTPGGTLPCVPGVTLPLVEEGSPWQWWNEAAFIATWDAATGGVPFPGVVMNCRERAANPDMSPAKGRLYIDSIMGYLAPRMFLFARTPATSVDSDLLNHFLQAAPNPARATFEVSLTGGSNLLRDVRLMDLSGRTVIERRNVNSRTLTIERGDLPSGLYLLQVQGVTGVATRRIVLE
ncbi:MAG: T9SS type A sorting domain-containing protein [Bacteroidia bacterium]|nr:T9SS type A sorting domain-containing protein [Bacteroidia bacterium]